MLNHAPFRSPLTRIDASPSSMSSIMSMVAEGFSGCIEDPPAPVRASVPAPPAVAAPGAPADPAPEPELGAPAPPPVDGAPAPAAPERLANNWSWLSVLPHAPVSAERRTHERKVFRSMREKSHPHSPAIIIGPAIHREPACPHVGARARPWRSSNAPVLR